MNKKGITIGIPAFNEEETIATLLESIQKQNKKTFVIDKILINSDGSTDNTARMVSMIKSLNPKITIINNKKRLGKLIRLHEIYQKNTSDILVTLDADVVLANPYVLDSLLSELGKNPTTALVSGNTMPLPPVSFIERLFVTWSFIWYEIRKNVKNGNHIQNVRGSIIAMKKEFAKSIVFPKEVFSDAKVLYLAAKHAKKTFLFSKKSIVYYRVPNSIHDYLLQTKRGNNERKKLAQFFGNWVYDEYKVPFRYKLKGLTVSFLKNPIYSVMSFVFVTSILKFFSIKTPVVRNGLWSIAKSSKKSIRLLY